MFDTTLESRVRSVPLLLAGALLLAGLLAAPAALPAQHQGGQGAGAMAAHAGSPDGAAGAAKKAAPPAPQEKLAVTRHQVTIAGRSIDYRAEAGTITIDDTQGEPAASMFYVGYFREGVGDAASRPLTFVFNGGPGSSAIWLHLGSFGPRRVAMDAEGLAAAPPYRLEANPESLLDVTDLVFLDPISTGYSRALPGVDASRFHSVTGDVESMAETIRRLVARAGRGSSPLFLMGESYGTIRASFLADYLQRRFGMYLNGVVLISPALNDQSFRGGLGNDLPEIVGLPTLAATAWYHGKLAPELQALDVLELERRVEELAFGRYASALLKGAALDDAEERALAEELSRYTSVPVDEVLEQDLRLGRFFFINRLLEDEQLRVGILDSRVSGPPNQMAPLPLAPAYTYETVDPFAAATFGVFSGSWGPYVRGELEFEDDAHYEVLSMPVAMGWDFSVVTNRYLVAADNLRTAMTQNPDLKVFGATGTYDLVTTPAATRHAFNHLGVDDRLRGNITLEYYPSGHMMYLQDSSLAAMRGDLVEFYRAAVP